MLIGLAKRATFFGVRNTTARNMDFATKVFINCCKRRKKQCLENQCMKRCGTSKVLNQSVKLVFSLGMVFPQRLLHGCFGSGFFK